MERCPKCDKIIYKNTSHQCPRDRVESKFDQELDAVDRIETEIRNKKIQKFDLFAKDIHPNALLGLIAIEGPVTITSENKTLRTKCFKFEYKETNYLNPFRPDNFPLVYKAVEEALRNNCRYIYTITNTGEGYYIVRAC